MFYCCVKGQGHRNGSLFSFYVCPDGTFWTAKTLVTELGTVIYQREALSPDVLWNVNFGVFKVTEKVQNVIDCLPGWWQQPCPC